MSELSSDFLFPVIHSPVFSSYLAELPKGSQVSAVFEKAALDLCRTDDVLPVFGLEIHICSQIPACRQQALSILCMEEDFPETRACPFPVSPWICVCSVELSRHFEVQVVVLVPVFRNVSGGGHCSAETPGVPILYPSVFVVSRPHPCTVFTQTASRVRPLHRSERSYSLHIHL